MVMFLKLFIWTKKWIFLLLFTSYTKMSNQHLTVEMQDYTQLFRNALTKWIHYLNNVNNFLSELISYLFHYLFLHIYL